MTLCNTLYMVGLLIGSFIGGPPADSFGRKPVLFGFILIAGLANMAGGLVSTIGTYSFFRLLAGIGEQGLTQVCWSFMTKLCYLFAFSQLRFCKCKPLSRPHGPVLFMNQVKRHIAGSGSNEARC